MDDLSAGRFTNMYEDEMMNALVPLVWFTRIGEVAPALVYSRKGGERGEREGRGYFH